MPDIIEVEILEDGTISVTTQGISGTNHISADQLLDEIETAAGGKRVTNSRPDKKQHVHKKHHVHA